MVTRSPELLAGQEALNEQIRYVVSPPSSKWTNTQRAEFIRILANAYGVGERQARLWTTLGVQRRPFLSVSLDNKTYIGRIILAQCLYYELVPEAVWSSEFVEVRGTFFPTSGQPLRQLLEEPYWYSDLFHWNYQGYIWDEDLIETSGEQPVFSLEWNYGATAVPHWLPDELRPFPVGDSEPFSI